MNMLTSLIVRGESIDSACCNNICRKIAIMWKSVRRWFSLVLRIPAWECEKVPSDLGYAVVFAGYSGFLHYLQLASHELATIGINVTKNEIPNSKFLVLQFPSFDLCLVRSKVLPPQG